MYEWKELEELGVDWTEYCKETNVNEWCRSEGYTGTFLISPVQLIKLIGETK